MKTWNYAMPLVCFLLYGRAINGTIDGNSRVEARSNLKKRLNMRRVPPWTKFEESAQSGKRIGEED